MFHAMPVALVVLELLKKQSWRAWQNAVEPVGRALSAAP
jgi:hypothetical protein